MGKFKHYTIVSTLTCLKWFQYSFSTIDIPKPAALSRFPLSDSEWTHPPPLTHSFHLLGLNRVGVIGPKFQCGIVHNFTDS